MFPKRFVAHWDFARKLINDLNRREAPDAIFISMPPLSTISAVTKWGRENSVPVVVDIIDPWPDSFIKDVPEPVKWLAKLLISPFYLSLSRSLNRASAISAISQGYLSWASNHHQPKTTDFFYLAVNFGEVQGLYKEFASTQRKNDQVLRLIYSGSLASSYDIPTILKAAEILDTKYPGRTEFAITGIGPQKALIEEYQNRTSNIIYLGWVTKEELIRQYSLSDIGLIQHKNSLTQTVTYKLFSYLSMGLPVLNSLQSEMVELIEENKVGMNNREENTDELVENIEKFLADPAILIEYKKNALTFAGQQGDSRTVYDKLIQFIENTTSEQSAISQESVTQIIR